MIGLPRDDEEINLLSSSVCENNVALMFDDFEKKRKQIQYIKPKDSVGVKCPNYKSYFIGDPSNNRKITHRKKIFLTFFDVEDHIR